MSQNEFDLIERYFKNLTAQPESVSCGIGDDAAIISIPADCELAVSTDALVAHTHFPEHTRPFDIGYKSLAVNLSDMAAMAARPRWATLSLTLPSPAHAWLSEFTQGFAALAKTHQIALIGGDLSQGPLSITVQIIGTVVRGQALTRTGARVGDDIYVTGALGCAALALAVLQGRQRVDEIDDCLIRLSRPEPRVEAGRLLFEFASAAIDISDGLAGDLAHLLGASGVSAVVELSAVPVCERLSVIKNVDDYWRLALASGDDYELCFTVSPDSADLLITRLHDNHCPVKKIGRVTAPGQGIRWLLESGEEYSLSASAYQHFQYCADSRIGNADKY